MSEPPRERIGILGGSFDPVHVGHLIAAQDACEHLALDRVLFLPAAQAPLRSGPPALPAKTRVRLLRAAIAGDPRFEVSTLELERGGTSYSVDSARALHAAHPTSELFWIIGADQAGRLGEWRAIGELAGLVEFIVLARPGFSISAASVPSGARLHPVAAHACEVSSSEIRERLAGGKSVRYLLPESVARLIEQEHLFR